MKILPLRYNLRSLTVRYSATLLTVLSIGATVAVLAGILSLRRGFETLFHESGREDLIVMMRPGATTESQSFLSKVRSEEITKRTEIETASLECYLATLVERVGGGRTNVPIRGVEQPTFALHGSRMRIAQGQNFRPNHDELIVGRALVGRIQGCALNDFIQLNKTAFKVVGVFEHEGPYESEIWGDMERLSETLGLKGVEGSAGNRVLAKLKPGVDLEAFKERSEDDKSVPTKVMTERDYLRAQTVALSTVLSILGTILASVMGIAAAFTGTNTMLSAIGARAHEIGVLLAIGFRPPAIFLGFLLEALLLGLAGGVLGCLLVLPLNGLQTGTTNWQTFSEVAFAFQVDASILWTSVRFSMALGLLGGLWPALRASRLHPTEVLRSM